MSCGHEAYIDLNSNKMVISSLSEASIESIYNFYENLIFTGKWSKRDIDSLLPFERVIFNSLYNESVKKHNEAVYNNKELIEKLVHCEVNYIELFKYEIDK